MKAMVYDRAVGMTPALRKLERAVPLKQAAEATCSISAGHAKGNVAIRMPD